MAFGVVVSNVPSSMYEFLTHMPPLIDILNCCYRKHELEKKRQCEQRVREIEYASFLPLVLSVFYRKIASCLPPNGLIKPTATAQQCPGYSAYLVSDRVH